MPPLKERNVTRLNSQQQKAIKIITTIVEDDCSSGGGGEVTLMRLARKEFSAENRKIGLKRTKTS